MKTLSTSRKISATKSEVWRVVSDVGGYSMYAPNIDQSAVVSGEGVGMVRECSNKDGAWKEVCTAWIPEDHYSFEVKTQEKGYPYPLKRLTGDWAVRTVNENETMVVMTFEYEFKHWLLGLVLERLMRARFSNVCEKLLDNWETAVTKAPAQRAAAQRL